MKLLLSGGGSGQESFNLDRKFIEAVDVNKPVLYIPIAIDQVRHPYPGCLEWLKGNFKPFGFQNFVMWTEVDLTGKTESDFSQFGGIYIGGGNTFKLLHDLKEFGTFDILKSIASKDVPIYGGSAGAIILTRSILPASYLDENEIGISDLSALNLIDIDIWCHYTDSMKGDLKEFMKKHDLHTVVAIPENAGLSVSEKGIEAVGPGIVTVFTGLAEGVYSEGSIIETP